MAIPTHTIHYFDTAGAAEILRLAATLANVDFNDARFPHSEWSTQKANFPTGLVPCLEIDNEKYAESMAILYYFCHASTNESFKFPTDSMAVLKMSQICSYAATEIMATVKAMRRTSMAVAGMPEYFADESEKAKKLEELNADLCTKMAILEKMAEQRGTENSHMDCANLVAYQFVELFKGADFIKCDMTQYTTLNKIADCVRNHPKVSEYYANKK